jgi:hypothetical protein
VSAGLPSAAPLSPEEQRAASLNLSHALTFLRAASLSIASAGAAAEELRTKLEQAIVSAKAAREMLP